MKKKTAFLPFFILLEIALFAGGIFLLKFSIKICFLYFCLISWTIFSIEEFTSTSRTTGLSALILEIVKIFSTKFISNS